MSLVLWVLLLLVRARCPSCPAEWARYDSIAEDVALTTSDPFEASLLVAIAVHESGLALRVDQGLERGWGAVCLVQLQNPGPAVYTDRRACFAEGLALARRSLAACRHLPPLDRLAQYASGSCDKGRDRSREILRLHSAMLWAAPRLGSR